MNFFPYLIVDDIKYVLRISSFVFEFNLSTLYFNLIVYIFLLIIFILMSPFISNAFKELKKKRKENDLIKRPIKSKNRNIILPQF